MTITKDQIHATLSRLAGEFPLTFVLEKHLRHRPLKVGIAADIRERCEELDPRVLAVALRAYTHRIVYLQSLVVGAARIDLDGNPAGDVNASQAGYAAVVLAEILARRGAQRSAAAAPAKPAPALVSAPSSVSPAPVAAAGRGLKGKPVLSLKLGQRR